MTKTLYICPGCWVCQLKSFPNEWNLLASHNVINVIDSWFSDTSSKIILEICQLTVRFFTELYCRLRSRSRILKILVQDYYIPSGFCQISKPNAGLSIILMKSMTSLHFAASLLLICRRVAVFSLLYRVLRAQRVFQINRLNLSESKLKTSF